MRPRLLLLFILLLLFSTLLACSRTRIAYNYSDWIISWYLDDFISFTDKQDDWLEQQLSALMIWHRRDQLPRYIQAVEQLQNDLAGPITEEIMANHFETIQRFWQDIMLQAQPEIVHLLLWLDSEQIRDLFKNIAEQQAELEEKYLNVPSGKRRQRRIRQTEKILRRFIGKLATGQRIEVEKWADSLIPSQRLWLENRQQWQDRLHTLLNEDAPESYKREQLYQLFVEPELLWSTEYRNSFEKNKCRTFLLLVAVHEQLTEKQKRHLQKRLERLKEDFMHLAYQPPAR